MLAELVIRDLALIDSAEVELSGGLNALTGETGAGKSLLVGALELLRGETPRGGAGSPRSWIRRGADQARVEGRFVLAEPMDATFVDDSRMYHGVTAVVPVDPARPAFRDVLVVTFRRE